MKHRFTKLFILSFLFFLTVTAKAQIVPVDTAIENITAQVLAFPQEKLYLQTDKPYYISGERIWFRVFVLNACLHRPSYESRYVYVELINPLDEVVIRHQIRPENDVFANCIDLPEELPQGNYRLRAYTRYMENIGEEYFFSRSIFVVLPSKDNIETIVQAETIDKKRTGVTLSFKNSETEETLFPKQVNFQLKNDAPKIFKAESDGVILMNLKISDSDTARTAYIEYVNENDRVIYKEYIFIPFTEPNVELSFYPEGGNMIEGTTNRIAFKALFQNGSPASIAGIIIDNNGDTVTQFATSHEGIGLFNFFPETGKSYFADYSFNNKQIKTPLPDCHFDAASLNIADKNGKLRLTINHRPDKQLPKLWLLAHCRGDVLFLEKWDNERNNLMIDRAALKSGVTHFLLLDELYNPLSERLVFNYLNDTASVTLSKAKPTYKKRDSVAIHIAVNDKVFSETATATMSVSITDDAVVQVDTTTNILAEILLVSELKGTVNNPAVYLSDTACEYADLLMMTHGWTRYNIPEIMKGHFQIPKTSYERSQSYSGKVVRGLLGVPANFINISLLCYDHDYRIFDEIKTDAMGRFTFNNLEVLDSTMLLLQAKKVNGGKFALELQPEKFVYPKISLPYAQKVLWVDNSLTNYINYAELKYTYENGIRNIKLPEITIYAKNPKGKFRNYKGSPPDYFITDDDIAEKKITTIKKLILSFPNTRIRFGGSYIEAFCKGNSADAPSGYRRLSIIINGFRYDMSRRDIYEVLLETNIMIKDIAEVDLITDLITLGTYYEESCPVLEIMTYNAIQPDLYPRYFNIQTVMAEGYKRPAEFYSPRYDTQEKRSGGDPDLRSTIYWKPDALTDENGNASVEFYTADTPTSYSVVIEGVCPDGTLIYKRENKFITVN